VTVLEAANESLANGGLRVPVRNPILEGDSSKATEDGGLTRVVSGA
jgi:hypothetical protein